VVAREAGEAAARAPGAIADAVVAALGLVMRPRIPLWNRRPRAALGADALGGGARGVRKMRVVAAVMMGPNVIVTLSCCW
jgi:hypothetical protein